MPKIEIETPITRECLQKLGGHNYHLLEKEKKGKAVS